MVLECVTWYLFIGICWECGWVEHLRRTRLGNAFLAEWYSKDHAIYGVSIALFLWPMHMLLHLLSWWAVRHYK